MRNNIKALREAVGLTQSELADRMGATGSTVSRLESGHRKVTATHLAILTKILRASASEILGDPIHNGSFSSIQIAVAARAGVDTWSAKESATDQVLPVLPFGDFESLAMAAAQLDDNHAAPLGFPKGSFAIYAPYDGARGKPVNGDIALVQQVEGKVKRYIIGTMRVGVNGLALELADGELIQIDRDQVKPWGLVVGMFKPM